MLKTGRLELMRLHLRDEDRRPRGWGKLVNTHFSKNTPPETAGTVMLMRKLLASRDFINCPTVRTKAEVWPLQNVIRTLSSIRYSLLVEILMWRNFWIVFSPRKSVGEKKMEVSRKLIVHAFCKRWKVGHSVA